MLGHLAASSKHTKTQHHSTRAPKNAYTNATRPFAHSHIQPPPAFPLTAAYPYHLHILADLPHRKEVGQAGNLGSRANEKDKLMCTTCVDPCRSVTREPIRGAKGAPVAGPGGSPSSHHSVLEPSAAACHTAWSDGTASKMTNRGLQPGLSAVSMNGDFRQRYGAVCPAEISIHAK